VREPIIGSLTKIANKQWVRILANFLRLIKSPFASVLSKLPRFRWQGNKNRGRFGVWLWLAPALIIISVFLVYPVIDTFRISLMNSNSSKFVGIENYIYVFSDKATTTALLNNLLWLVLFTLLAVGLGVIIAVLTGRVRYEAAAKAIIFIPMAISFVAAGVIWKFIYAYRPEGFSQIGLLNAVGTGVGLPPVAWLVDQQIAYTGTQLPSPLHTNNFALIFVGVWMWTGFAMVILSAGLKSIPNDIMEAARVDGATEWQIFWRIILPILGPTIAVVATTLIIQALKIFDVIWVMTSGNYGTDVVSTLMYKDMFNFNNFGHAGALAVILLLAVLPIMLINIGRFRVQGNR
jgi:alpha-glucoside transport system permease protein